MALNEKLEAPPEPAEDIDHIRCGELETCPGKFEQVLAE